MASSLPKLSVMFTACCWKEPQKYISTLERKRMVYMSSLPLRTSSAKYSPEERRRWNTGPGDLPSEGAFPHCASMSPSPVVSTILWPAAPKSLKDLGLADIALARKTTWSTSLPLMSVTLKEPALGGCRGTRRMHSQLAGTTRSGQRYDSSSMEAEGSLCVGAGLTKLGVMENFAGVAPREVGEWVTGAWMLLRSGLTPGGSLLATVRTPLRADSTNPSFRGIRPITHATMHTSRLTVNMIPKVRIPASLLLEKWRIHTETRARTR
mmetsp:Transcript_37584/g.108299  ORF Transcript_37584/g.108299 Transcript_37584/m.108299 type:complete len:266 (-) Transcript_37584:350-1147(-)